MLKNLFIIALSLYVGTASCVDQDIAASPKVDNSSIESSENGPTIGDAIQAFLAANRVSFAPIDDDTEIPYSDSEENSDEQQDAPE